MISLFYKTDDQLWNSGWFPTLVPSVLYKTDRTSVGNQPEFPVKNLISLCIGAVS